MVFKHCFKQLDDTTNIILQLLVKKITVFSLVPCFAQAVKFSVKSVEVKKLFIQCMV